MIIDSNATTFFIQQQIHETGKHPLSISWLIYWKKGLELEYEPNLSKTYNPKRNSGKLSAIYSAPSILHTVLKWMKDVVKNEYFLQNYCVCNSRVLSYTREIFSHHFPFHSISWSTIYNTSHLTQLASKKPFLPIMFRYTFH